MPVPHDTTASHAAHALGVIDGETRARQFLERLAADLGDGDDLVQLIAPLHGPALSGFCAALVKVLRREVQS